MSKSNPTSDAMNAKVAAEEMLPGQRMIANLERNQEYKDLGGLTQILREYTDILDLLRRELRGEEYMIVRVGQEDKELLVQTNKPVFIRTDNKGKPIMVKNKFVKNGQGQFKLDYLPHEDAIETVVSILRFSGINKITLVTNLEENEILADLRDICCKLAKLLALKQLEWGLDKELMPTQLEQLKTIIKDARMVAKNGQLLRNLQSSVHRIEQVIEGTKSLPKTNLYN